MIKCELRCNAYYLCCNVYVQTLHIYSNNKLHLMPILIAIEKHMQEISSNNLSILYHLEYPFTFSFDV